jgi:hypothetical protein
LLQILRSFYQNTLEEFWRFGVEMLEMTGKRVRPTRNAALLQISSTFIKYNSDAMDRHMAAARFSERPELCIMAGTDRPVMDL